VLEELLLDARSTESGELGARASARAVGERLAISKDTAAKALRRLVALGLARREDHRDTESGVFARSVYVLDVNRLADLGLSIDPTPRAMLAGPARRAPVYPKTVREHNDQPSLFELTTPARP